MQTNPIRFPAEWHPQSGVQLTWPHADTDWEPQLTEVIPVFVRIAEEIAQREKLLIVCQDAAAVRAQLRPDLPHPVLLREIPSNDTWARDHGGISLLIHDEPVVCDFVFNGWGLKHPSHKDNRITERLFLSGAFAPGVRRLCRYPFVLEGGSLDSNGQGLVLTTSRCLDAPNRNEPLTPRETDRFLTECFGLRQILRLESGALEGDDTDGHIDTLARFCNEDTIAYVQCTDRRDTHYPELRRMYDNLASLRQPNGEPFRLVPLPMADPVWEGDRRLAATYANFLVINHAVLMPCYASPKDRRAADILAGLFPQRQIVGIPCLPLLRQNGSLHCLAMHYPLHFL
ncbi:MAG: agmatine deiminase family protein [Tannerellaceae bacterium]|nr:agmatine deiminase family protein [Tannerellaceae bacterium]